MVRRERDRGDRDREFSRREAGYRAPGARDAQEEQQGQHRNDWGERGEYDYEREARRHPSVQEGYGDYERDWNREPQRGYSGGYAGYPGGYGRGRDDSWSDRNRPYGRESQPRGFGGGGYDRNFGWGRGAQADDPTGSYERGRYDEGNYSRGREMGRDQDQRGFGQRLRDIGEDMRRSVKRIFRGPKGYKRSDERIREDVCDRLGDQDDFDPSDIEVQVSDRVVTLTGTVQLRWHKFRAEEIADEVSGVEDVQNQLRVQRQRDSERPDAERRGREPARDNNARA